VFCPRCGTDNDPKNRFCVSCGSELKEPEAEEPSKGIADRLRGLLGRSRKERLITGGIVLALAVAVIALLALGPNDDSQDSTASPEADAACVKAKQAVASAATEARGKGAAGFQTYSARLIAAMLDFRGTVRSVLPPSDAATQLNLALRDAAIAAGGLARLAREGAGQPEIGDQVARLDAATKRIDSASEAAGLSGCANVRILPAAPQQG
jgi:hypothetical protein